MSFNPEITFIEDFEVEIKGYPIGTTPVKFPLAQSIPLASDDCKPPSGGCSCAPYTCN